MILTLVFCQSRYLGEELEEVRQVVAEELGSNDEVLAGVVVVQLSAEEFRLALYP